MPNRPIDIRGYQGRQDLEPLLHFASRSFAERFPLGAQWHPGDIVWQLKPDYDRPHGVRLWFSGDRVEAVVMFTAADQLWFETLPEAEDLVPDIIARAERARLRNTGDDPAPKLSIRLFAKDARRIATLEALGYRDTAPEGIWFRRDLSQPLPDITLPEGFRIRDCTGIDSERRAAAHRDAWSDLSQIGITNARSTFSAEMYQSIAAAPYYDATLDLILEAPDGTYAANCICWPDPATGIAIFEPTGTHPAYRSRGLMRLVMLEAMRRLQERGFKSAGVGTAHFNTPARSTYGSIATQFDETRWWTKVLA
ncbi:MAG TPA: GNAT family N-acetyltransferase [Rhizomicrobium sp.]|jgi:GNAT superfamily N-acetyltransferase|nr:GNAT family N-acetyltransferase [Rhizomicrobium sp.]